MSISGFLYSELHIICPFKLLWCVYNMLLQHITYQASYAAVCLVWNEYLNTYQKLYLNICEYEYLSNIHLSTLHVSECPHDLLISWTLSWWAGLLLHVWVVVAEWLRWWTRNPLGYSRTGSNPVNYDIFVLSV